MSPRRLFDDRYEDLAGVDDEPGYVVRPVVRLRKRFVLIVASAGAVFTAAVSVVGYLIWSWVHGGIG